MAPNRKNVTGLVQALSSNDLEGLQNAVQPKFLPLTDASEASKHVEGQQQQVVEASTNKIKAQNTNSNAASYWDWPADAEIEQEQHNDLFSASRMEANLIRDAAANAAKVTVSKQVAEHDDYWAEEQIPSTKVEVEVALVEEQEQEQQEAEPIRAQNADASYWEWPATQQDASKVAIRRILQDEQARQRTSAVAIERAEMTGAAKLSVRQQTESIKEYNDSYWQWDAPNVAPHVADPSHPNANYWDWSPEQQEHGKKTATQTIQAILEYEAARELLTADHMVEKLQAAAPVSSSGTKASSDDYWTDAQSYGDDYWQWSAESKPAVISTGKGYWDW